MKYISLFAGIGGFDLALNRLGHEAVYVNEWDKYAAAIYEKNFDHKPDTRDIRSVQVDEVPDFDLLCGGFPCQTFSIAGRRGGFSDTRGTLFHEIARLAASKRPTYLLLENVKGLLSHDNNRTFQTILRTFDELGYDLQWQVLNSKNFGVPQNRERVFIVGCLRGSTPPQIFPFREGNGFYNQKITGKQETREGICSTIDARYGAIRNSGETYIVPTIRASDHKKGDNTTLIGTYRTHKDGGGFRELKKGISPTIPARAREDGSGQPVIAIPVLAPDRLEKKQNGRRFKEDGDPSFTLTAQDRHGTFDGMKIRRLTPIECERLQGFPDGWTEQGIMKDEQVTISDTQRYKCLGNAVTVNVVYEVAKYLPLHL